MHNRQNMIRIIWIKRTLEKCCRPHWAPLLVWSAVAKLWSGSCDAHSLRLQGARQVPLWLYYNCLVDVVRVFLRCSYDFLRCSSLSYAFLMISDVSILMFLRLSYDFLVSPWGCIFNFRVDSWECSWLFSFLRVFVVWFVYVCVWPVSVIIQHNRHKHNILYNPR